jgi:dynactin complex subunit
MGPCWCFGDGGECTCHVELMEMEKAEKKKKARDSRIDAMLTEFDILKRKIKTLEEVLRAHPRKI